MKGQDLGYTGVTLGEADKIWETPGLIWVRGHELGYTGVNLGEG